VIVLIKPRFVLHRQISQVMRNISMPVSLFLAMAPLALAQNATVTAAGLPLRAEAMLTLPESPGSMVSSSSRAPSDEADASSYDPTAKTPLPMALPRVKFISAGQAAPPQQARDKVILGLRESITPFSALGWLASAGYSHVTDSSPNFGTNSEAFGKRFGAAVALGVSKEIFSDSIMAPVFHQDPRYYQLGRTRPILKRAIYAATRPVIGRTDGGRTIPNFAFLAGTGGAAALTQTYYPTRNQSASEIFQTFGTSLGGSAIGGLFNEFGGDVARILHLSKHE
jgi:hypothetical protein